MTNKDKCIKSFKKRAMIINAIITGLKKGQNYPKEYDKASSIYIELGKIVKFIPQSKPSKPIDKPNSL